VVYHELRTYRVTSPNMMEHLHRRMRERMSGLLRDNGMRLIGVWEVAVGKQMPAYMYMLEWDDLAHRERGWAAFYADPRVEEMNAATYRDAGGNLFHDYDVTLLEPADYVRDTVQEAARDA